MRTEATPAPDVMASALLDGVQKLLANHARREAALSPMLCADVAAGMDDLIEHIMGLEALARSAGILPPREFYAAVGRMPPSARRRLGRETLRRVSQRLGTVMVEGASS